MPADGQNGFESSNIGYTRGSFPLGDARIVSCEQHSLRMPFRPIHVISHVMEVNHWSAPRQQVKVPQRSDLVKQMCFVSLSLASTPSPNHQPLQYILHLYLAKHHRVRQPARTLTTRPCNEAAMDAASTAAGTDCGGGLLGAYESDSS